MENEKHDVITSYSSDNNLLVNPRGKYTKPSKITISEWLNHFEDVMEDAKNIFFSFYEEKVYERKRLPNKSTFRKMEDEITELDDEIIKIPNIDFIKFIEKGMDIIDEDINVGWGHPDNSQIENKQFIGNDYYIDFSDHPSVKESVLGGYTSMHNLDGEYTTTQLGRIALILLQTYYHAIGRIRWSDEAIRDN